MELVPFALFAFKCGQWIIWKMKRQEILKELKGGKLPDGKFREIILNEVNWIIIKLEGEAWTDLKTSISLYKEGLTNLNAVLNSLKKPAGEDNIHADPHAGAAHSTKGHIDANSVTFAPKLDFVDVVTGNYKSLKVTELNKVENEVFEKGKTVFRNAALEGAKAFNNVTLTTLERIHAQSIRIMSTILESVDNPEAALPSCSSFLEEINSMSDVQEIFRLTVTSKAKKSPLNKEEKIRVLVGVCHLNRMVFDVFQLVHRNKVPWNFPPIIVKDGGKVVHRIDPLRDVRVAEALSRLHHEKKKEVVLVSVTEFPVAWSLIGTEEKLISPRDITSNNQGQIIVADNGDRSIKVFDQSGECMQSFFALPCHLADEDICGVATDHEDNIFVLIMIDKFHFTVFLFDKDGQLLNKFPLEEGYVHSSLVINERSELLMLVEEKDTKRFAVQKYKTSNGKSDKIFGQDILEEPKDITVTHGGHCLVLSKNGRVTVFDAEGKHQKELDFDYADDTLAEAIAFHSESNHVVISNLQPEFRVKVSIFNEHRDCERSIFQGAEQLIRNEQRECVPPKIAVTKNGNIAILSGFVGECKVIVV